MTVNKLDTPLSAASRSAFDNVPEFVCGKKYRIVSEKVVPFTLVLAKYMMEETIEVREREISQLRISRHLTEIGAGRFLPELVTLAVAYVKGHESSVYRINGQHMSYIRYTLAKERGNALWTDADRKPIKVTFRQYECDDFEALKVLHASYDSPISVRSKEDVICSYFYNTKLDCLSKPVKRSLVYGLNLHLHFNECDKLAVLKAAETLLKKYHVEALKISSWICQKNVNATFKRTPVIAAMFATLLTGHSADAFWDKVIHGVGLKVNDPENSLRELLLSITQVSRPTLKGNGIDRFMLYNDCTTSWNLYRQGKPGKSVGQLKHVHGSDLQIGAV